MQETKLFSTRSGVLKRSSQKKARILSAGESTKTRQRRQWRTTSLISSRLPAFKCLCHLETVLLARGYIESLALHNDNVFSLRRESRRLSFL